MVSDCAGGLIDATGRFLAHRRATVEHAVYGGDGDSRFAGQVIYRRARSHVLPPSPAVIVVAISIMIDIINDRKNISNLAGTPGAG